MKPVTQAMLQAPCTPSLTTISGRIFGLALTLLALAACIIESPPEPKAAKSVGESTGVLQTTSGAFAFTPTTCAVYVDDGINDIEVQGPGTAPNGEAFFFELSSTANALSIGLGAHDPFSSPQHQLKAGRSSSREFTIELSGPVISATNLEVVDEHGNSVASNANLLITCR